MCVETRRNPGFNSNLRLLSGGKRGREQQKDSNGRGSQAHARFLSYPGLTRNNNCLVTGPSSDASTRRHGQVAAGVQAAVLNTAVGESPPGVTTPPFPPLPYAR